MQVIGGSVSGVGPGLSPARGEEKVEADGRWLIPGLWDSHVHLGQWVRRRTRLDVAAAGSAAAVTRLVADRIAEEGAGSTAPLVGVGFRPVGWPSPPTVGDLDAVSGNRPVVLISGDAHSGWLNTAALRLLGLPDRPGPVGEREWFAAYEQLVAANADPDDAGYRDAMRAAAQRGVVGVVDLEFGDGCHDWAGRFAAGADLLRVRVGVYPDRLQDAIEAGWHTGTALTPGGLARVGPVKIITDGALNSRTAWCWEPFLDGSDPEWRGVANYTDAELVQILELARRCGFAAAVHAIGDAALTAVVDAFERTGAPGSVEHLQLARTADLPRLARAGIRASVQPAHLLDDRDVTQHCWPDRTDRCFMFRSMLDAGITLALGSDAPVAPLDPWLAMAAAVHRSADDRPPWNPRQAITPREALVASTDGRTTVAPGAPADLVLLDDDPLRPARNTAEAAARLRAMPVSATMVAGRFTHLAL